MHKPGGDEAVFLMMWIKSGKNGELYRNYEGCLSGPAIKKVPGSLTPTFIQIVNNYVPGIQIQN